jgi:energy-coupling factor transporter ATP-binding protein EcfA2
MYKLVKIIALNFGNMVQRDYQFSGDLTLISGANGSGKSTLEDLVQCVMTGDTKNIVNYNAGQKEDTTKKHNETQRSFASYILGGEELRFTREQALGVAALVFKNRVTGKIFTAWLYGEAELTGKKGEEIAKGGVKELGFCYNAQLDSNDFLIGEDPNGDIKQLKELRDYFEKKYKRDLYICDKKEEYIMKLYASFNDKTSIPYSGYRPTKGFFFQQYLN